MRESPAKTKEEMLVNALIKATKEDRIRWISQGCEMVGFTVMVGGYDLIVFEHCRNNIGDPMLVMQIESIEHEKIMEPTDKISELFNIIRRKHMKIDEVIDKILMELEKTGNKGEENHEGD